MATSSLPLLLPEKWLADSRSKALWTPPDGLPKNQPYEVILDKHFFRGQGIVNDLLNGHFKEIFGHYHKCQQKFWHADELSYDIDVDQISRASAYERDGIIKMLAFFYWGDKMVVDNLEGFVTPFIVPAQLRKYFSYVEAIENVHDEVYEQMPDHVCLDRAVLQSIRDESWMLKNAHYHEKKSFMNQVLTDSTLTFGERVVFSALFEGVGFQSSFEYFKTLSQRKSKGANNYPAVCLKNQQIREDEEDHVEGWIIVLKYLEHRPTTERVHRMAAEVRRMEIAFALEVFPKGLDNRSPRTVTHHINTLTDRVLARLGYPPLPKTDEPDAMEADELFSDDEEGEEFSGSTTVFSVPTADKFLEKGNSTYEHRNKADFSSTSFNFDAFEVPDIFSRS